MALFSWMNLLPNKRIDSDTPLVVIKDLAKLNQEDFGETIFSSINSLLTEIKPLGSLFSGTNSAKSLLEEKIYKTLTELFSLPSYFHIPLLKDEIESAIKFVNPEYSGGWTEDSLVDSLNWFNEFSRRPIHPGISFYFGLQTPTSTRSYNSIMLYRILSNAGVKVDFHITDHRMAQLVALMATNINSARDRIYHQILEKLEISDLIKFYDYGLDMVPLEENSKDRELIPTQSELASTLFTFSDLERVRKLFSDSNYVLERISPSNPAEAIVLAANLYATDISMAEDPQTEYHHLRTFKNNVYTPLDEKMKELALKETNKFSLVTNFNPRLPEELYKYAHLNDMALSEGYTLDDIEDESAYSLLQLSYYTDTFYHGKQPGIVNVVTLGDEIPIEELPKEITLCYGTRNNNKMYAFRYQDLNKYFSSIQSIKNPIMYPVDGIKLFDNPLFEEKTIRKLKELCSLQYSTDKEEYVEERKSLLDTIRTIERMNDSNYQKVVKFASNWNTQPVAIRFLTVEAIHKLFTMAMHMRGWSGEEELPIEGGIKASEIDISLRVTQDIIDFESTCNLLGEMGRELLDLPIYIYEDGEYVSSHNPELGRTIKDRLEMVKGGENYDSINSCIKMTSGWFMCTAQYIFNSIVGDNIFEIDRFNDISV